MDIIVLGKLNILLFLNNNLDFRRPMWTLTVFGALGVKGACSCREGSLA